ncbi:hypothetical protein G6F22_021135 [Rhizopus arrhizus]|nr:hypothetical protein G6F22_021135 [Rhizopus arrhizus]
MPPDPAAGALPGCHLRVGIRGGDAVAAGQPARNRLAQRRVALGGRVHGQAAHVVADRLRDTFRRGVLGLADRQIDGRQAVRLRAGGSQQRPQFFERVGV